MMSEDFSGAMHQHLHGNLQAAEILYRKHLALQPNDPQGQHYLGFLLQQTGHLTESTEHLSLAIALDGRHSAWHFNLGITYYKQGYAYPAIAAFMQAVALESGQYFYWTNLGCAFELNREWIRAEQSYQAAIALNADCADAYYLLSALCLKQQRFKEARHYNYNGIISEPEDKKSRIIRAQAYYELGRHNEALAILENWLSTEPDHPVAAHLLDAYLGKQQAPHCSRQYIERTFEEFANSFDSILTRLEYSGPDLVKTHLATLKKADGRLSILDLGCGTGLIGEVLNPYAKKLTGVDLSAAMLAKAAEKQRYHQLHHADISDFLNSTDTQYDLITCMDTFIYTGKLDILFKLIAQRLKTSGQLLFSTEKLTGTRDYQLNISGRYSHHSDYLSRVLNDAGLRISEITEIIIRNESGCPIAGQLYLAERFIL